MTIFMNGFGMGTGLMGLFESIRQDSVGLPLLFFSLTFICLFNLLIHD